MSPSPEFDSRHDDFLYRYEWAREFAIDGLRELVSGDLDHRLECMLEIDVNRKSAGARALIQSWIVFRMARYLGKEEDLREMVCLATDEKVASIFDVFAAGRLGAFRLHRVDSQWTATMLTGISNNKPLHVEAVIDEDFDDFNPTIRVVVGWLLELDAHPVDSSRAQNRFIIEGTRLAKSSAKKLENVLERHPWGQGDSFRGYDYESDIMSLLLDTNVEDTKRNERRIFLPTVGYWRAREYENLIRRRLPDQIIEDGFPSLRNDLNSTTASAPRADLSHMTPERMGDLQRDLNALRKTSLDYWYYYEDSGIGPQTLELYLPDTEILPMLGFRQDGTLPLPEKLHATWLDYRLTLLPLESEWIRSRGLATEWSIGQGLRWAKKNLADDDMTQLQRAVDHHLRVLRWRTLLVAPNSDEVLDSLLPPLIYDEMIQGIIRLLPSEHCRPISSLLHPLDRTWTGLLRRLNIGPAPQQIKIQDLPRSGADLGSRKGFGRRSVEILTSALVEFCVDWPESAGHFVATKADGVAHQNISEGLDELDDLFY